MKDDIGNRAYLDFPASLNDFHISHTGHQKQRYVVPLENIVEQIIYCFERVPKKIILVGKKEHFCSICESLAKRNLSLDLFYFSALPIGPKYDALMEKLYVVDLEKFEITENPNRHGRLAFFSKNLFLC